MSESNLIVGTKQKSRGMREAERERERVEECCQGRFPQDSTFGQRESERRF
jgi:hypothetical protein